MFSSTYYKAEVCFRRLIVLGDMTIALYTNFLIHHQLPLARELVRMIGGDMYRYIYHQDMPEDRRKQGYGEKSEEKWILHAGKETDKAKFWLAGASCLLTGERDIRLFKERLSKRRLTIYCSERWFKPRWGFLRLLRPSYFMMAKEFVRMLRGDSNFYYFPIGIHAAKDMARLCGLFAGDLKCLFRAPEIYFEKKAVGKIWQNKCSLESKRYCLDKMKMWGYFVSPKASDEMHAPPQKKEPKQIFWCGRFLRWKRIDTLIKAVSHCHNDVSLDIYGVGPMLTSLQRLAKNTDKKIRFHEPMPAVDMRKTMGRYDTFVLSSDETEGWGAVVSEALEEELNVIGTYEAGSSATILPEDNLFHAGDWKALSEMLDAPINPVAIKGWDAKYAASSFMAFALGAIDRNNCD